MLKEPRSKRRKKGFIVSMQDLARGLQRGITRHRLAALSLVAALPLLNAFVYAWVLANRVISRDQWFFLPMLRDYIDGHFHPVSLWLTHSQHRIPVYKLLFLLDAIFLKLNMRFEIMLGCLALGLAVILLMRRFRATAGVASDERFMYLGLAGIAFLGLSLNQWASLIYGLGALNGFGRIAFFVGFWLLLDSALRSGPTPRSIAALCTLLTFILLGWAGAHGPAYIAATFSIPIIALMLEKHGARGGLKLLGSLALCALVAQAVYWLVGPLAPLRGSATEVLQVVIRTPWRALEYIFLALGSSAMPVEGMENHGFPHALSLFAGALVGAAYLASIVCYIRARLWRASYLPGFLMVYSLLVIASIFFARMLKEGIESASAPRYVLDTQLGLIGCYWTLYSWRAWKPAGTSLQDRVTAVPVMFGAVLLLEAGVTGMIWQHNAYQRQLFQQAEEQVRTEDFGKPNWVCPNAELCRSGTEFLKKEQLNIFGDDGDAAGP